MTGPLPMPYVELPSTANQAATAFSDGDWAANSDGVWNIELPSDFTFRYWGTTFTYIRIGGNGAIIPATSANPGGYWDSTVNPSDWSVSLPYQWSALGAIAPFWDNWSRGPSAPPQPGGISYDIIGSSPSRVIRVQWKNLVHYACSPYVWQAHPTCGDLRSYSFQAWLFEAPATGTTDSAILFSYGTPVGPPPSSTPLGGMATAFIGTDTSNYYLPSGVIGLQDITGTSAAGPACGSNAFGSYGTCDVRSWPANQMYLFGNVQEAELVGVPTLASFVSSAEHLELRIDTTVQNLGQTAASFVGWDLYFSSDSVLDLSGDVELSTAHVAPLQAVPAQDSLSTRSMATIPRPADGWYHVCVDIDPTDQVDERIEANNRGCSASPFLVGKDLIGSVSAPALCGPGEEVSIPVTIRNRGSDPIAPFTYEIYFSADQTLDPSDRRLHSDIISGLLGSQVHESTEQVFVPANLVGNQFYVILAIDRAGQAPEIDETNNVVVAPNPITLVKPDLHPDLVTFDLGRGCYFGMPLTVSFEVCNDGGGHAWNFTNSVYLSENAVITSYDLEPDASPQSCPSGLDSECADIGGGQPFCYQGVCHPPCNTDFDCGDPGLVCAPDRDIALVKTCQQHIAPGTCERFTRTFDVPTRDTQGYVLHDGDFFVGVIADSTDRVDEEDEANQIKPSPLGFDCRHPRADLAAISVVPPAELVAGEPMVLYRVLRNIGNVAGTAEYRYFLSSNQRISEDDIPLATDGAKSVSLEPYSEDSSGDFITVPAQVEEGDYWLGVLVDPAAEVDELDESNNFAIAVAKVHVLPARLRVRTASLPDAQVGALYVQSLLASGGDGPYHWEMDGGSLPPGITLSDNGILQGTAADEGTWVFSVSVKSGDASAHALLALRVTPPMGSLAVATESLPFGTIDIPYNAPLAAMGGMPPYSWTILAGLSDLRRSGIDFAGNGLVGVPLMTGTVPFKVRVTDSIGNTATRDLDLVIITPRELAIIETAFADGTAGIEYRECVNASGGSGTYVWSIDSDSLPAGLAADDASSSACVVGEPKVCGHFSVGVTVTDDSGQSATASLPLTIGCSRLTIEPITLRDVRRGEPVQATLHASTLEPVSMRIYAGSLPAGVTLGAGGELSGVVGEEAAVGTYNFLVEVTTGNGGYGLSGLSITVVPEPLPEPPAVEPKEAGSGCSASGGSPAGLGVLLVGLVVLRSRRRAA